MLHESIRTQLQAFLASRDVPGYVGRALRKFVDCGLLANGFVRVRCPDCHEESLVAFSCKDRGFCPSCTARRGAATAAQLVDEVLPHVAHRQYVLALPPELHGRVARDSALETELLRVVIEELGRYQRVLTRTGDEARPGSVTFLQHFGSTLNLHVHIHVLALDGVYAPDQTPDAAPRFIRSAEPTSDGLRETAGRIARRARALVAKSRGREPDEEHETPLLRLGGAQPREPAEKRLHARVDGFDLHASPPIQAEERAGLERFIRYAMRGPLANSRLAKGPKGCLLYRLKTPKADGATEVLLKPMVLLERLARLIPLPGMHMVRFHGVLAPAATWRNLVVARPRDTQVLGMPRVGARRIDWASLMKRVFAVEILACACGGTRRVIATIEKGPVASKILRHLGLPDELPRLVPASVSQLGLWETGPPSDDAPAPPDLEAFDQSPHLDPYA